jgi:hypothetical protein
VLQSLDVHGMENDGVAHRTASRAG